VTPRAIGSRFVVLSGCSGGGKTTLLAGLARRGHAVVEEPGRRIVAEELAGDGSALPWVDLAAFARCAVAMALEDRAKAPCAGDCVFFDRGLVDAAAALAHATGEPVLEKLCRPHPYHRRVFLAPPWPAIYATDAGRRHGFEAAVDEYARLLDAYSRLGYEVTLLPKTGVAERADLVLDALAADRP
jgi:predicted ATPase